LKDKVSGKLPINSSALAGSGMTKQEESIDICFALTDKENEDEDDETLRISQQAKSEKVWQYRVADSESSRE